MEPSLELLDIFVEDYDNLMFEIGHTVQGIGRMLQSKFGMTEEDHDDLIAGLLKAARVVMICKHLEYPDAPPMTAGELIEIICDEDEETE